MALDLCAEEVVIAEHHRYPKNIMCESVVLSFNSDVVILKRSGTGVGQSPKIRAGLSGAACTQIEKSPK